MRKEDGFPLLHSSFILLPFLGGRIGFIAVYGQASNMPTRRLAMMNLAFAASKVASSFPIQFDPGNLCT